MQCTNCGAMNSDESRFCEQCGTALAAAAAAPTAPAAAPVPAPAAAPAPAPVPPSAPAQPFDFAESARAAASGVTNSVPPGLLFMPKVIDLVSRGSFFRKFVALLLRIGAGFTGVGGVLLVLTTLITGFQSVYGVGDVIALLLSVAVMVVAVYMFTHLLVIRARTIAELEDSEYTAIPIASVLIKLSGEMYAVGIVTFGITGFVAALFAGSYLPLASSILSQFGFGYGYGMGAGAFLGGIVLLVASVFAALISLIFTYMFAEAVVVVVNMARDLRAVRAAGDK